MKIALPLILAADILLLCLLGGVCLAAEPPHVEVPVQKNAPPVEGHPLTAVAITQCNLIVAVYVTLPDGRLQRFDKSSGISADQLLALAYTAVRSERIEVSCNDIGAVGYERRDPV